MAEKRRRYPSWVFPMAAVLVGLHQNFWLWDDDRLILGFPVNLFYHIVLSVFLSAVMFGLVKRAWPDYSDAE